MRACSVSGFILGGLPSSLLEPPLAKPGNAEMVSAGSTAEARVAVMVGVECFSPSMPFLGAEGSTDGKGGRARGPLGAITAGGTVGVGVITGGGGGDGVNLGFLGCSTSVTFNDASLTHMTYRIRLLHG